MVDGIIAAKAKNGETVTFEVNENYHELLTILISAADATQSNLICLEPGNEDKNTF